MAQESKATKEELVGAAAAGGVAGAFVCMYVSLFCSDWAMPRTPYTDAITCTSNRV